MSKEHVLKNLQRLKLRSEHHNRVVAMHGDPYDPDTDFQVPDEAYHALAKHSHPLKWTVEDTYMQIFERRQIGRQVYQKIHREYVQESMYKE